MSKWVQKERFGLPEYLLRKCPSSLREGRRLKRKFRLGCHDLLSSSCRMQRVRNAQCLCCESREWETSTHCLNSRLSRRTWWVSWTIVRVASCRARSEPRRSLSLLNGGFFTTRDWEYCIQIPCCYFEAPVGHPDRAGRRLLGACSFF